MKCEFTREELRYMQVACAMYETILREISYQTSLADYPNEVTHQQINDKLVRYIYPGERRSGIRNI